MDAIDLTLSDSDQDVRLVKRQRRSLSDDDVQVIEKPEVPTPAVSGPEPALGDKDLLITRATGPVWNQDLPHSRTQCGKYSFVASKNLSNREHCSKCFCYVCDVEADKCQLWGSGHSNKDHCNAHGGRSLYRDMRSAARRPRLPVLLSLLREGPTVSEMSSLVQCKCYICDDLAAKCKHWGTGAARSDHLLPDPTGDAEMLELGTIHLPIRARALYTVADLQERLVAMMAAPSVC
ncbi:hypothetical protein WJX75_008283 [Coccomyxa subellipsoidea]|uniref:Uncharacterized protein n=1 Tax=Coccomyxa subellipsoidea TaxID=248742 RepID=A0ABR2Z5R1_9CHLO